MTVRATWPFLVAVCGVILFDALVFRGSFYRSIIEPDSYAGAVERLMLQEAQAPPGRRALVLGDSRIAEGFSARIADGLANGRVRFANGSVPASSPRCWYYLLRDLDPGRNRYAAIVLPFEGYNDEDRPVDAADRVLDLRVLITRLRLGDTFEFVTSFADPLARLEMLRGVLLKGTVLNQDARAFLANPAARLENVRRFAQSAVASAYAYPGRQENLAGLEVDWERREFRAPPGTSAQGKETLRDSLFPLLGPQNGRRAIYHRRWLGAILDRYRGTGTRIVIARVPRSPVPRPQSVSQPESSVRQLGRTGSAVLLGEHAFASLERPEFFFDGFHMNAEGRKRFSAMLVERLERSGIL